MLQLRIFKIFAFVTVITLSLVQFGIYFDDVDHIGQPDPDCPICQVVNANVIMTDSVEFNVIPNVIFGVISVTSIENYTYQCLSFRSTRAPPRNA